MQTNPALLKVVQTSTYDPALATCDPALAAKALASADWNQVRVALQRLQTAAFIVLIISLQH